MITTDNQMITNDNQHGVFLLRNGLILDTIWLFNIAMEAMAHL